MRVSTYHLMLSGLFGEPCLAHRAHKSKVEGKKFARLEMAKKSGRVRERDSGPRCGRIAALASGL